MRRLSFLLFALLFITANASAVSPPNLPLPDCEEVDGVQIGACPEQSPEISLTASGDFSEGATVNFTIDTSIGACDGWSIGPDTWAPSPCFSKVDPLIVYSCYHINFLTDEFERVSCSDLYVDIAVPFDWDQMFSFESDIYNGPTRPSVTASCGAAGDFSTYYKGGPASDPAWIWSARGPQALKCQVTFEGPRPDGLYGPTWVLVNAWVKIEESLGSTTRHYAGSGLFVPLEGDLRDFGPLARFSTEVVGRRVQFDNESLHPADEALSYQWDFGDGNTSTSKNPVHVYEEPGTYSVSLVVKDPDGDEDSTSSLATVTAELVVQVDRPFHEPEVGEEAVVKVAIYNYESSDISDLKLPLTVDPAQLEVLRGPSPTLLYKLPKNENTKVDFVVKPLRSGATQITATAEGSLEAGVPVSGEGSTTLYVAPQLGLELSTSVISETRVGEEIEVVLTLTNNEEVTINGITAEPLGILPNELLSVISGPTSEAGTDPRVAPVNLASGASTTFTWVYRAEQTGSGTLTANVSGQNPYTSGTFFAFEEKAIAIESVALSISNLHLRPGKPVPGTFASLRGKIENIGSVDITDIDFEITSTPMIEAIDFLVEKLDVSISPPDRYACYRRNPGIPYSGRHGK